MLARVFALLSLALFVSAGRIEARTPQCNGGSQYCCSDSFGGVLGAAGVIQDLLDNNCSVLNVVGTGCAANQQNTCCQQVQGGEFTLIDTQCSNFNLNL
ncbi:hypothetical protein JVT61DRAFT_14744 [Boletus reticuloceps]|uniref:Hydrophobin n=1 Tax=Boletus reticuloceps TaxID=495285 RepID=A0A8I2YSX4_9AGAM|nr:hypothetical protein JVT61DRAFT_14744 [Boletus reticuloceps]